MRDDDFVSIVLFEQHDNSPIDLKQISPVHFVSVKEMRKAFDAEKVSITQPKGVEEGSEIRVMWTCAVANQQSIVTAVESTRVSLAPVTEARKQSIQLSRQKGKITLLPQVNAGDKVEANQIVAAVVPVNTQLQMSCDS